MRTYCRRCCKSKTTLPGKTVIFYVHSKHHGYAEIVLPNHVCFACAKDMKDHWESLYPQFNKEKVK